MGVILIQETDMVESGKPGQVPCSQFSAMIKPLYDSTCNKDDGTMNDEEGYNFSNMAYKIENPGKELPREIFDVEWPKVAKVGQTATWETVWEKAKRDGIAQGWLVED